MTLTKVSYSMIKEETINVVDQGADTTGLTDSSSFFSSAFTKAETDDKTVYVPSGTYKISSGLVVPAGVTVVFDREATLNFDAASGNVFTIKNNSSLVGNGATINATNSSWTDAIFYFNGAEQFFVNNTNVSGFVVNGPLLTNQQGIGVLMSALNVGDHIAFVRIKDIHFYSLSYAVYVTMPATGSPNDHYVNGNFFENLLVWNTAQAFYVSGASGAISTFQGNILNNIQYQTNNFPGGRVPFEFRDGTLDNFMTDIFIWDWLGGSGGTIDPIQFIGASSGNYLLSNINPYAATPNTIVDTLNANTCQYIQGSIKYSLGTNPELSGIDAIGVGQVGNSTSGVASDPRIGVTQSVNAEVIQAFKHSGTDPRGWRMYYSGAAPNDTTHQFWLCEDTSAIRAYMASNGGLYNYSANDSNLSDERLKDNIASANSYLEKVCSIPVKTFNYKDQLDGKEHLGVIAQDVLQVAPELVNQDGFATKEGDTSVYLSVYQTDLQFALMKALQELKADFDEYRANHP